jgi:hypothetical protein
MLKCPMHADDSESLAVFPDHLICFGCSFRIQKRMDALAWLLKLPSWREALEVAEKYRFLPSEKRKTETHGRPPTSAEVTIYERILQGVCADRLDWFYRRGLTYQTVWTARLGHTGAAFVIPVFDGDFNLVTLRYRNDEEICGKYAEVRDAEGELIERKKIPKYRGWPGHNQAMLYPLWKFENDWRDYAVVVEGELDALRLWQENIPAITVTNGAGQQGLILEVLREFFAHLYRSHDRATAYRRRPRLRKLVICGDRDGPGIEAARKTVELARKEYEEVTWLQWPVELGKDVTDALQNGYTFERLTEEYEHKH